jgi:hypothetical protein
MDAFERFVRAGTELAGETVGDVDLTVMRVADAVYGSQMRALMAEDLSHVMPETDLDPSRAPAS